MPRKLSSIRGVGDANANCVKNSEDAIVKLTGVEFLDKDGKPGFLERPVAVHYCNGGDITNFLTLSALSD